MSRNPSTSSGLKSASAVIMAIPGTLNGLQVIGDGTNAATVTIYDSSTASTSGLVLAKIVVDAGATYEELVIAESGIVANNGIYAVVSGTGAEYIVQFAPG